MDVMAARFRGKCCKGCKWAAGQLRAAEEGDGRKEIHAENRLSSAAKDYPKYFNNSQQQFGVH
jgi:hypothetical protein